MFLQFIMPYYGSADLAIQAITSILDQTDTKDIGLIVVDDNHFNDESREQSTKLCLFLNEHRNDGVNITYIKNDENLGVGKTRNIGLAAASGEYVAFIDSDDKIEKEFVAYIKEKHNKRPSNIYVCLYDYGNETQMFIDNALTWLHGKVYKLQFLRRNNITFPPLRFNEDSGFNLMTFEMTKNVSEFHDDKVMYHWQTNTSSLTSQNKSKMYSLINYVDAVSFAAEKILRKYHVNNTIRIVPTILQIYQYYIDVLFENKGEDFTVAHQSIQKFFDIIHDTGWYQSEKQKNILAENFFALKTSCIAIPAITLAQFVSKFEKEPLNFQ